MKNIFCHTKKCLSCRSCEIACALAHSTSKNLAAAIKEKPLPKHRIHIEVIDKRESMSHYLSIALQCRHCDEPLCAQACISGGIYKDVKTGAVLMDSDKCVACWSCIMVCPFGAILRHKNIHKAIKCDLCHGRETPVCIEACPTAALVYCEKREMEKILKNENSNHRQ